MSSSVSNHSSPRRWWALSRSMVIGVAALAAGLFLAMALAPGAATADSELTVGMADDSAQQARSLTTGIRSVNDYNVDFPTETVELILGETVEVSLSEGNDYVQWFTFTPEETGRYQFVSSTEGDEDSEYYGDPYGALYADYSDEEYDDNSLTRLSSNDDADDSNFKVVSPNLQAGKTYYLACSSYGSDNPAFYAVTAAAVNEYDLSNLMISNNQEVWDDSGSMLDALGLRIASHVTDEDDDPIYLDYQTDYDVDSWYEAKYDEYGDIDGYDVCAEPTKAGDYRLTLKGLDPYTGTADVYFSVLDSKDLKNYTIRVNEAIPSDGGVVTLDKLNPRFYREYVDVDGEEVEEEVEIDSEYYAITGWRNADTGESEEAVSVIGEYLVTISGVGSYHGDCDIWFEVVSPKDLYHATITVTPDEPYYSGGEVGYDVEVVAIDGTSLQQGTHYAIEGLQRYDDDECEYVDVSSVDSAGSYRVIIQAVEGSGYEGTGYGKFNISVFSINDDYAFKPYGDVPAIKVGSSQAVSLDNEGVIRWFSFTPDKDGDYFFKSSEELDDPRASLFGPVSEDDDEYGNYDLSLIKYNDDGAGDLNFEIKANNLQAGVTYYLACGSWEDSDSYLVSVYEYDLHNLALCSAEANSSIWAGTTATVEALGLYVEAELEDGSWTTLVRGKDYELDSWLDSNKNVLTSAPKAVGDYYVRLKGLDPYKGTLDVSFRIRDPYDIARSWNLYARDVYSDEMPIDGNKLGLSLEFYGRGYAGAELNPTLGKHYKVVAWYDDEGIKLSAAPSEPGYYEVEIEGISPYHGKTRADFSVYDPKYLSSYDCDVNSNLWYNGKAMTFDRLGVKLYRYGKPSSTLTYQTDYKFIGWYDDGYEFIGDNPTAGPDGVGYYYAKIEGTGKYAGTRDVGIWINDPLDIASYDHPWAINVAHDGKPLSFEKLGFALTATAENGSAMSLAYGKDYTLTEWVEVPSDYDDDEDWIEGEAARGEDLSGIVNEGYYNLYFQGIDPHYGTASARLHVVNPSDLTYASVAGLPDGSVYHSNFSFNPVVYTISGQKLTAGKDYDIILQRKVGNTYQTVTSVTGPGSYRVLIEGKSSLFGGYSGSTEQEFEVLADSAGRYNIANAKIGGLATQTYAGRALTPAPVVKLASTTLVANKDYTVSYANNVNAGVATITVKGKGFYTGSKSATFTINKAAGSIAIKAKKKTLTIKVGKSLKASKAFKVTKNTSKGKVTYKKTKGNKKITVAKNGKIKVKKGLKAGTYKIKVKATSAATANYKAATSKVITVKIKVK